MNIPTSNQSSDKDSPSNHAGPSGQTPEGGGIIELHLRELSQLFDAMDPSPFRERDLDPNAEEYIVDSLKELPSKSACALVIHLDQPATLPDKQRVVGEAVREHFARRSRLLHRDLRRLIHRGFISLAIGVTFLSTLFVIARIIGHLMGDGAVATLLRESLLIAGWVAMWRPIEIFLYDWWPILSERRVHDRLSRIAVCIVHKGSAPGTAALPPSQNAKEAVKALARWETEGGRTVAPKPEKTSPQ